MTKYNIIFSSSKDPTFMLANVSNITRQERYRFHLNKEQARKIVNDICAQVIQSIERMSKRNPDTIECRIIEKWDGGRALIVSICLDNNTLYRYYLSVGKDD